MADRSTPPAGHPELVLMLLADARAPTSGHTQSAGLEPALARGLSPVEIPSYCRTRLRTVALVEAATAVVARHHVLVGAPLDGVEDAWAARTPSEAMRQASYAMGRGCGRLALRVWPGHASIRRLATHERLSRPSVLGTIAAIAGLSPDQLIRLVGYDDVQTVLSAALKLCPFDPAVAAQVVVSTFDDIERLVDPLRGLTDPYDIPAPSAPLIEAWVQSHAHTPRRLFSA
jgi:urease accessory protein